MEMVLTILFWTALFTQVLMLANAILNARTIRNDRLNYTRPNQIDAPEPFLSVLVPARNEAQNLPRLISSFATQEYSNVELLVYDDLSEDATWDIIVEAAANSNERIRGIKGGPLPDGWVGKVNACHQLAEAARGDVFFFLDADMEFLNPTALQQIASSYTNRKDHTILTGMPALRGNGKLLVSGVGHIILATIPWWLRARLPSALFAGLNGQCWVIDAEAYRTHLPHQAVRNEVLEDVMIGRYLFKIGLIPALVDWQNELAVYMYQSLPDAWSGFKKNSSSMLGPTSATALATWTMFTALFVIAPVLNPSLYLGQIAAKFITDRVMRQPIWLTLAIPISFLIKSMVGLDSILARARGELSWKGRTI
jgi:glycosyltransferase involved in cell wall biosynthesis